VASFEPNRPIITDQPEIEVDAGLKPGVYRFQLVVEDEKGARSLADEKLVTIVDKTTRDEAPDERKETLDDLKTSR
jgi:hypothetical protein